MTAAVRRWLPTAGFVVAFAIVGLAGRESIPDGALGPLMWPAAGVGALWALERWRAAGRWVDAVLLVAVLAAVDVVTGLPLWLSLVYGVGHLLTSVLVAALFVRWQGARGVVLTDLRDLAVLLAVGATCAALFATIGTLGYLAATGQGSPVAWGAWFARNTVPVVMVVAGGLLLRDAWHRRGAGTGTTSPVGRLDFVGLSLITVVAYLLVFVWLPAYPIVFPMFALTVWAALRLPTPLVVVREVLVATLVTLLTWAGLGPIAQIADPAVRTVVLQAFIGIGLVLALALALARDERVELVARAQAGAALAARNAEQVEVLSAASRAVLMADDARTAVCAAVREVSGADAVFLLEPTGDDELVSTVVAGRQIDPVRISLDPETSLCAKVFVEGSPYFVADAVMHPMVSRGLVAGLHAHSIAWRPAIGTGGRTVAVIGLVWEARTESVPELTDNVLAVLGTETARAIERSNLVDRLADAADRDQLTGLANRRRWDELAAAEVTRARRSRFPLTMALVDLDHFKAYNDSQGHQGGDLLLRDFARAAELGLRDTDLIARWGGEEFAVALPACTAEESVEVLDRLRAAVPHGQTCTIGVAQWTPGETVADVLARADAALYEGKTAGRNRVVLAAAPQVCAVPV